MSQTTETTPAEQSSLRDFGLWAAVSAALTLFYLGMIVHPEAFYQIVRPDASTAYFAIHPEQNSVWDHIRYVSRYVISLGVNPFSAVLLYGLLAWCPFALLWGIARPRRLWAKVLCLAPLCLVLSGVQACWMPVILWTLGTILVLGVLCLARMLFWKKPSPSGAVGEIRFIWTVPAVILAGVMVYTFLAGKANREEACILSLASRGNYVKALVRASSLNGMSPTLTYTVRYSLYQQGQLLENLFMFPLDKQTAVLPIVPFVAPEPYYKTMLAMGFVNSGEHFAMETLERVGDAPEVYYDLGIIYTLKEQPEIARVYWNYLARNPLWKKRAEELLAASREDPSMKEHPAVKPYYAHRFTENYFASADPAEFQMRQSLKNDPRHQMALEFLAAEYLGYKNHAGIISLLPVFRAQNYSRLPRHIEEALCSARLEDPAFSLSDYTISPNTEARFQHFRELYSRNAKASSEKIFETLAPVYGDTYWFYHLFSTTGSLKMKQEEDEE